MTDLKPSFYFSGDTPDFLYVLVFGALQHYVDAKVTDNALSGQCVGELSFLFNSPRSSSVVAARRSTLYRLSRRDYLSIVEGVPFFFRKVPLFVTVDSQEAVELYPHCSIQTVKAGETAVRLGDPEGYYFCVVVKGAVNSSGVRNLEYFGEEMMLQQGKGLYEFSVKAIVDTIILRVSPDGFNHSSFSSVRTELNSRLAFKSKSPTKGKGNRTPVLDRFSGGKKVAKRVETSVAEPINDVGADPKESVETNDATSTATGFGWIWDRLVCGIVLADAESPGGDSQ